MREKEEDGARPRGVLSTTRALSKLCPPLARRAPVPTLKSSVILAFSNKATSPNQKKKKKKKHPNNACSQYVMKMALYL